MKVFLKTLVTLIVAINALLPFAEKAQAQTPNSVQPPTKILPIGTEQEVINYALSSITHSSAYMWVMNTNQQFVLYTSNVYYGSPKSKYDLDQQILATWMTNMLLLFAGDSDLSLDRSKDVRFYFDSYRLTPTTYCIFFNTPFVYVSFVKTGASYTIPDLSWFSMSMKSDIAFYVPGLRWARVEIGYAGSKDAFEVDDNRLDKSTDPIASDGGLVLPTSIIMNSSPTGAFWMQISLLTDSFKLIDGNGLQIQEPQANLRIDRNDTTDSIIVQGGPSGRGYVIQRSLDMKNWSNCIPTQYVPPVKVSEPLIYSIISTNNIGFYRSVTTNSVPY